MNNSVNLLRSGHCNLDPAYCSTQLAGNLKEQNNKTWRIFFWRRRETPPLPWQKLKNYVLRHLRQNLEFPEIDYLIAHRHPLKWEPRSAPSQGAGNEQPDYVPRAHHLLCELELPSQDWLFVWRWNWRQTKFFDNRPMWTKQGLTSILARETSKIKGPKARIFILQTHSPWTIQRVLLFRFVGVTSKRVPCSTLPLWPLLLDRYRGGCARNYLPRQFLRKIYQTWAVETG